MPKSAAKGFVSAISDAMAFLVVDPVSGAVKKLKASAALASDSVDGLMSSDDKAKLDGFASGKYTPSFTSVSGVSGTSSPADHNWAFVPNNESGQPGVMTLSGAVNATFTGAGLASFKVSLPTGFTYAFSGTGDGRGPGGGASSTVAGASVTTDASGELVVSARATASGTAGVFYAISFPATRST